MVCLTLVVLPFVKESVTTVFCVPVYFPVMYPEFRESVPLMDFDELLTDLVCVLEAFGQDMLFDVFFVVVMVFRLPAAVEAGAETVRTAAASIPAARHINARFFMMCSFLK